MIGFKLQTVKYDFFFFLNLCMVLLTDAIKKFSSTQRRPLNE